MSLIKLPQRHILEEMLDSAPNKVRYEASFGGDFGAYFCLGNKELNLTFYDELEPKVSLRFRGVSPNIIYSGKVRHFDPPKIECETLSLMTDTYALFDMPDGTLRNMVNIHKDGRSALGEVNIGQEPFNLGSLVLQKAALKYHLPIHIVRYYREKAESFRDLTTKRIEGEKPIALFLSS